jgi:hypothetical protein
MLPDPVVGGGHIGQKTQGDKIHHVYRVHTRLYQFLQNLIIPIDPGYNLVAHLPSRLGQIVMMPCLAVVAAESLVGPSVADLIAAFQAYGHPPFIFLIIVHAANLQHITLIINSLSAGFSFSYANSIFFILEAEGKKDLNPYKKDSKDIKNGRTLLPGA